VARSKPQGGDPSKKRLDAARWSKLTWDDLDRWAGGGAVSRGRTYQRGGRVKDLKVSGDGELLATVAGTERYATSVSLGFDRDKPTLESSCTCFVGVSCKHAVATVAEYLEALAESREVPVAAEDDKRWAKLENVGDEVGGDWEEDDEDDDFDTPRLKRSGRSSSTARSGGTSASWDDKIQQLIRGKSKEELTDLVWTLTRRFPEVYQEFRERIALEEGDVSQLVAEARQEIRQATSEPGYGNPWEDHGYSPDFRRITQRFDRLLELGHADEVVSLGRTFIRRGIKQISESDDEGETMSAFSECLPVIFQAVSRSRLSGPKRLLFAIDAHLLDDYDAIGSASDVVLDAPSKPQDWSAVADALLGRLESSDAPGRTGVDGFLRSYGRDNLTNWIAQALGEAGRGEELLSMYEAEARTSGSYVRLVNYLIEAKRFDDAERRATEGIAAMASTYSGIGDQLAANLSEIARHRKQWDIVAAYAARPFFERPSLSTFDELIKAAKKAKAEKPVRAAALRFLETGEGPYRFVLAPPAIVAPRPTKSQAPKRSARPQPLVRPPEPTKAKPDRLIIDTSWPLPVPDALIPLIHRPGRFDTTPRPHLDVLLQMAIAAKKPDEVLRWFDKLRAQPTRPGYHNPTPPYADSVAVAVSATHPERAIEIYRAALDAQLLDAKQSAYDSATGYLKKLLPIYEALGRRIEWDALLASIREKYRNRPRFMETLDRLEARPIVDSSRTRRK